MISHQTTKLAITLLFAATAGLTVAAPTAEARKGKDHFVKDYKFKKPMHGYSGHSGNYYCDYQRLPIRKCKSNGKCKVVGWKLRQSCY